MNIREAQDTERDVSLRVEKAAFGTDVEADLVAALLDDPTAEPRLSLLACDGNEAIGHILFTNAQVAGSPPGTPPAALLAPLAVAPEAQGRGVGGALINRGLQMLKGAGTGLVFVLGDPRYYTRFGFAQAGRHGLQAPYPIPKVHEDAWMVQALRPGLIGPVTGTVRCADAISKQEYWVE